MFGEFIMALLSVLHVLHSLPLSFMRVALPLTPSVHRHCVRAKRPSNVHGKYGSLYELTVICQEQIDRQSSLKTL